MEIQRTNTCQHCDDGDGGCLYPYYGLAPHVHKQAIGGTEFTGAYPVNFSPDGDGMGVYTHCLHCGNPESSESMVVNKE